MPLLHCNKCHHELEGNKDTKCDWCGSKTYILEDKTALESMLDDIDEILEELRKENSDD